MLVTPRDTDGKHRQLMLVFISRASVYVLRPPPAGARRAVYCTIRATLPPAPAPHESLPCMAKLGRQCFVSSPPQKSRASRGHYCCCRRRRRVFFCFFFVSFSSVISQKGRIGDYTLSYGTALLIDPLWSTTPTHTRTTVAPGTSYIKMWIDI